MSTKLVGELPATTTFKARDWSWVPLPEIGGGLLTVTVHRPIAGDREDIYAVRADGDGFLLRNTGTGATYRCVPSGLTEGCSCPAGMYRGDCKHRTALLAVFSPPGVGTPLGVVDGVVEGAEGFDPEPLCRQ